MTSILSLGPDAQRQVVQKLGQMQAAEQQAKAEKRPKYGNKKTSYRSTQGFERLYDSILEARTARTLDEAIAAGSVRYWLPQVPILLPGGVRLVVDFLAISADGRSRWIDAKGRETQASINKRKQAKALYGIDIELVRR